MKVFDDLSVVFSNSNWSISVTLKSIPMSYVIPCQCQRILLIPRANLAFQFCIAFQENPCRVRGQPKIDLHGIEYFWISELDIVPFWPVGNETESYLPLK